MLHPIIRGRAFLFERLDDIIMTMR